MSVTISPTELDLYIAVRAFLQSILPTNCPVIRGQTNRVPEPASSDFVEITPLFMQRLSSLNIDTYADCALVGSITGTTLAVTVVTFGSVVVGAPVYGAAPGTSVVALGTGTGGVGTYTISPAQTIASTSLYAGTKQAMQPLQMSIQVDVHGPNSASNTNLITTLWRDDYAVQFFVTALPTAAPLYATDPRQLAFDNAEAQYEDRWTLELVAQMNVTVQIGQQFADQLSATAQAVEALA